MPNTNYQYTISGGHLCTSGSGGALTPITKETAPRFCYNDTLTFRINFSSGTFSAGETLLLSLDKDRNFLSTSKMADGRVTLTSGDIVAGYASVVVRCTYPSFAAAVNGARFDLQCWLEVARVYADGLDSEGGTHYAQQRLTLDYCAASPVVGQASDTVVPIEPQDYYYTKEETDALLTDYVPNSVKGVANGVASLDANAKVPSSQLPAMDYVPISEKGAANGVATLDANAKVPSSQVPALNYEPSGTVAAHNTNEDAHSAKFSAITEKIPAQATAQNQLADKDFVNSSINNIASYYITKDAAGNPFATKAELDAATVFYSGGGERVPTRNDYTVVLEDESKTSAAGETPTTRYLYNSGWQYQYIVNNTGFTAAQFAAINSGITSSLVWQIGTAIQDSEKGVANGVASLDNTGKVPISQIPSSIVADAVAARDAAIAAKDQAVSASATAVTAKDQAVTAKDQAVSASATAVSAAASAGTAAASAVAEVIPLQPCTAITATYSSAANTITWSDPADITTTGLTITWAKTRLVRKENSYPATYNDGTVIVENTIRDQYKITGYTDSTIDPTKVYRYALFSQTNTGAWNSWAQNRAPYPTRVTLGPITNAAIIYGSTQCTLKWKEPNDNADDGYVFNQWIRTVIVRKVGSYPASINDGDIVAVTHVNPASDQHIYPAGVTAKAKYYYYDNPYVDSNLTAGSTYYYKAFNEDQNGLITSTTDDNLPYYTSLTPTMLAYQTRLGNAQLYVQLGDLIELNHAQYPGQYMQVVGFDCNTPVDTSRTHTLDLVGKYLCESLMFQSGTPLAWGKNEDCGRWSHDTVFGADHTYGILANNSYVQLTAGTHYEIGGNVATYDGVQYPITDCYLRPPRSQYCNCVEYSLPLQWLNATGSRGNWWTKQYPNDNDDSNRNAEIYGWRYGLSAEWEAATLECVKNCNDYFWGSWARRPVSDWWTYRAKWWMPTPTEVGLEGGTGGTAYPYFNSNSRRVKYWLTAQQSSGWWWLSRPLLYIDSCASHVSVAGSCGEYGVNGWGGCPQACCIG